MGLIRDMIRAYIADLLAESGQVLFYDRKLNRHGCDPAFNFGYDADGMPHVDCRWDGTGEMRAHAFRGQLFHGKDDATAPADTTFKGGDATSGDSDGGYTAVYGGAPSGDGNGGEADVIGADGTGDGDGGEADLVGGDALGDGNGGLIRVLGGDALGGGDAGAVVVAGGAAAGAGLGGTTTMQAGDSDSGTPGNVVLHAGSKTTGGEADKGIIRCDNALAIPALYFADLPTAACDAVGTGLVIIIDATTTVHHAVVSTGGGTDAVLAWYNGVTNQWRVA